MLHVLQQQYPPALGGLLTTLNEAFDRVAMHVVRRTLLQAQADAAGLPLHAVNLPWPCSNADYEQRMGEAVRSLVADGFTHVAFGDLFLEDVRKYREERLRGTGLTPLFPLWKTKTTRELAEATKVPVVSSGGVGTLDHLRVLRKLPLQGAIVGRALYDGAFTISEALAAYESE